jgi:formamidopyrimidine-DNA glycosylase
VQNQTVHQVIIRQPKLRWLIPAELPQLIEQQTLLNLSRRAKYLLLHFANGTLLIHLGMSASFSLPLIKSNSITKPSASTVAPNFSINSQLALAVPPVASKSSINSTRSSLFRASVCPKPGITFKDIPH